MRLAQGRIACVAIAVLILSSVFSFAGTIQVTTLNDELNNDTDCSLREAIQAANTNSPVSGCHAGDAGLDIIKLGSGTYSLTLPGKNEDNNATGDLDIIEDLEIIGSGATISGGVGDPNVMGDGIRLLHLDPFGIDGVDLTLNGVTLQNADIGCRAFNCEPGAATLQVDGDGDVVFENGAMLNNTSSCSGENCGSSTTAESMLVGTNPGTNNPLAYDTDFGTSGHLFGIQMGGGDLTIRNVRVEDNLSTCKSKFCFGGDGILQMGITGDLLIANAEIIDNEISCEGPNGSFCNVSEMLSTQLSDDGTKTIINTRFIDNRVICIGEDCNSDELIEFDNSDGVVYLDGLEIRNNLLFCRGPSCDTDELLPMSSDTDITLINSIIEGNHLLCEGIDCDTDEILEPDAASGGSGTFTMRNVRVLNNTLICKGEACDVDELIDDSTDNAGAVMLIENTEWVNNIQECIGLRCDSDDVIDLASGIEGSLTIRDTLFHRNKSLCTGEVCAVEQVIDVSTNSTGVVTFENVVFTENETVCTGLNCVVNGGPPNQGDPILNEASMIDLSGSGDYIFINSTIADNIINRGRPIIQYNGSGAGSLTISKSAIASNDERGGGFTLLNSGTTATTAINNWWGCNEGPNLDGCDTTGGVVTNDPWLIMTLEISPNPARAGDVARTIGTLSDPGALASVHFFTNSNGETIPNTIQRPVGFTIDQPASISGLSGSAGLALFGVLGLLTALGLVAKNWQPFMRIGGRRLATTFVIMIFAAIGLTGCGLGNIPAQQATAVSFGGIAQVTIASNIPGQVTLTATADNETIVEQVFFIP